MLLDDLVHVLWFDSAVPDALGIDDDRDAEGARVQTSSRVGPDPTSEASSRELRLEYGMNLLRALESTATLRIILGASIDADENVSFIRRWHVSTLKPIALAAQKRVVGRTDIAHSKHSLEDCKIRSVTDSKVLEGVSLSLGVRGALA